MLAAASSKQAVQSMDRDLCVDQLRGSEAAAVRPASAAEGNPVPMLARKNRGHCGPISVPHGGLWQQTTAVMLA